MSRFRTLRASISCTTSSLLSLPKFSRCGRLAEAALAASSKALPSPGSFSFSSFSNRICNTLDEYLDIMEKFTLKGWLGFDTLEHSHKKICIWTKVFNLKFFEVKNLHSLYVSVWIETCNSYYKPFINHFPLWSILVISYMYVVICWGR